MSNAAGEVDKPKKTPPMTWEAFLKDQPPGELVEVSKFIRGIISGGSSVSLNFPDLVLHCSSEACSGDRIFARVGGTEWVQVGQPVDMFITYLCRNCESEARTYAVRLRILEDPNAKERFGLAVKFGEQPPFGPTVPERVLDLLGEDRLLFQKGRRAENQGMGVGAFTYYRRVLNNQKDRLFDEIIQVARRTGAPESLVSGLEKARGEWQFTRSVENFEVEIPEQLKIEGQNPLKLLHRTLSQGMHDLTDEECLGRAGSVRVVLTKLAEKIEQALADEAEVKGAITKLLEAGREKVEKRAGGAAARKPEEAL